MAFDPSIAERVREALTTPGSPLLDPVSRRPIVERAMFGGLAFFQDDAMFACVLRQDLIVRVTKAEYASALAEPHVRPMNYSGRTMRGFVCLDAEGHTDPACLRRWLAVGMRSAAEAAKTKAPKTRAAKTNASRAKTNATNAKTNAGNAKTKPTHAKTKPGNASARAARRAAR